MVKIKEAKIFKSNEYNRYLKRIKKEVKKHIKRMSKNNILTEKEKIDIKEFIEPFRDKIICIEKVIDPSNLVSNLYIYFKDKSVLCSADFEDEKYKGMEPFRKYWLEELKL